MNQPIYESAGQGPDVATSLRRQWKTIVASAMIGLLAALALVTVARGDYESQATVLVLALKGDAPVGGGKDRSVSIETQVTVARASNLINTVAERLNTDPRSVRRMTEAIAAPTGDVMYLVYRSDNANRAAEGAKVYAEEYLLQRSATALATIEDTRARLTDQSESLTTELGNLDTQIAELKVTAETDAVAATKLEAAQLSQRLAQEQLAQASQSLAALRTTVEPGRLIVEPSVPRQRTGTNPKLALIGGSIAGALIGAFIALLRDRRDDRLGSAWRPDLLGIHELGRVELVTTASLERLSQDHPVRGEYTRLLLRFASMSRQPARLVPSIMITTVDVSSSAVAALGNVLDGLSSQGLFNGSEVAVVDIESVPVSATSAAGTRWQQLGRAIEGACVANDLVLVKVPPIGRSADGLGIVGKVDHIVLLVTESTPVADVVSTMDEFRTLGGSIAGIVVIAASHRGRAAAIRTPTLELPNRNVRRAALDPVQDESRARVAAYLSTRSNGVDQLLTNGELTESQRALEAVLQRLDYQSRQQHGNSRITESYVEDRAPSTNGHNSPGAVPEVN